jgi:hypothetical protein
METTKLEQLQPEISEQKEKIKAKEKTKDISDKYKGTQDNEKGWKLVNRNRSAKKLKSQTLSIQGKYRVIISYQMMGRDQTLVTSRRKFVPTKAIEFCLASKQPIATTNSNTLTEGCYHRIAVVE